LSSRGGGNFREKQVGRGWSGGVNHGTGKTENRHGKKKAVKLSGGKKMGKTRK